ncbi:MAG TPA: RIP metalloprotease RseP [Opitutaceae bacterium]|nr:RIP metalloprotease RseP [Opitutaceae bacterium]
MSTDLLHALASNIWIWLLIVLFFGGSIFVHELGHFLAARWRGAHVERFSIGFGPKIVSWRRGGTEYRLSWLPLGGYVLLPQLADLGAIEGASTTDVSKLPPVSYTSKLIVFVAGALFNVLFAFGLACIVWLQGEPVNSDESSTRIGYVTQSIELPDHTQVPSPALQAGLRIGDRILAVDGQKIGDWTDLVQALIMGAGRDSDGRPQSVFTVQRDGRTFDITVHPRLSGDDRIRKVGIAPAYEVIVHEVQPGSLGEKIGLRPADRIVSLDGTPVLNVATWQDYVSAHAAQTVTIKLLRGQSELALHLPPHPKPKDAADIGADFATGFHLIHPSPFAQIEENLAMIFRMFWSLFNPHSDIGLSKFTGPVGIVHLFHSAAEAGMSTMLSFTILINVNLAILNLLPLPILDGGQILFATIGKLRGRALPLNIIAAMQSIFLVLFLSIIAYVSVLDFRRWGRDIEEDRKAGTPPPAPVAPARP